MTAAEIKDRAIDATVERMRREGFEKIRLVDIAKDLGLSHAALYSHFLDKAALLDAVSERWLRAIDEAQELFCRSSGDPLGKIHTWFLNLHRAKIERVRHDPELFRAFSRASNAKKDFIQRHLTNVHNQLLLLVNELIAAGKILAQDPDRIVRILFTATAAFHAPAMVAEFLDTNRESQLHEVLDTLLRGLGRRAESDSAP